MHVRILYANNCVYVREADVTVRGGTIKVGRAYCHKLFSQAKIQAL